MKKTVRDHWKHKSWSCRKSQSQVWGPWKCQDMGMWRIPIPKSVLNPKVPRIPRLSLLTKNMTTANMSQTVASGTTVRTLMRIFSGCCHQVISLRNPNMVLIVGVSVAKWSGFLVIQTDRLISLLPTDRLNLSAWMTLQWHLEGRSWLDSSQLLPSQQSAIGNHNL